MHRIDVSPLPRGPVRDLAVLLNELPADLPPDQWEWVERALDQAFAAACREDRAALKKLVSRWEAAGPRRMVVAGSGAAEDTGIPMPAGTAERRNRLVHHLGLREAPPAEAGDE